MHDTSPWWDSPAGYGRISRLLHWSTALLLLGQFGSIAVYAAGFEHPVSLAIGHAHVDIGLIIMLGLVPARLLWARLNRDRRPRPLGPPWQRRLAGLLHGTLYLLLFLVPALALVRAFGNGRGLVVFKQQVIVVGGPQYPALSAPADLLHSTLAWCLLALIAGHVAAALYHALVRRDGTLRRMTCGPVRSPSSP